MVGLDRLHRVYSLIRKTLGVTLKSRVKHPRLHLLLRDGGGFADHTWRAGPLDVVQGEGAGRQREAEQLPDCIMEALEQMRYDRPNNYKKITHIYLSIYITS